MFKWFQMRMSLVRRQFIAANFRHRCFFAIAVSEVNPVRQSDRDRLIKSRMVDNEFGILEQRRRIRSW